DVGRSGTLVTEDDAQSLVEECGLLEAGAQRVVVEVDGLEDRFVGPELDGRAGLIGLFALRERRLGLAAIAVGLTPCRTLTLDLDLEARRERVHHRRADTVQTARAGAAATTEPAPGMQHGEGGPDAR